MKPKGTEPTKRRLILEAGNLVIVHPRDSDRGLPLVFEVDQVSDGLHWFLGRLDGVDRGQRLLVESPVNNDARYVNQATVAAASEQTFALEFEPTWERVQQRAFVRVSAQGVELRVVRFSAKPEGEAPAAPEDGKDDEASGDEASSGCGCATVDLSRQMGPGLLGLFTLVALAGRRRRCA